ncbi:MAG: hypothetical protein GF355_15020 [Candidatus Eisenbacteria bacterium]|nr:hypothetical protein [Candidatus Eisenbacteria bacterium]
MDSQSDSTSSYFAPSARMLSVPPALADTVDFELLGPNLGRDLEAAIESALSGGAIFRDGPDPLVIFREALSASIRDIESHPRGILFQEFLLKGPYEDAGEIPRALREQRLSDADTAAAITFIFSHMVNCFKGAVAELFAARACMQLLQRLQDDRVLSRDARLYVGDSVTTRPEENKALLRGADIHILLKQDGTDTERRVAVAGVVEVKSYRPSQNRLRKQLDQHLLRARRGLHVCGVDYPAPRVTLGYGKHQRVLRIAVVPGSWRLPRSYRLENSQSGRLLWVDRGEPPREDDDIVQVSDTEWRITLRWSKEALAEAAYEMTFWYMGKVGEIIYSQSSPKGWEGMTSSDAGRNAARMMLYYAILRARNRREEQRAIALYNSYGFGYALGMNYINAKGRREMLWPQDLDEILSEGKTKEGCTIR